MQQFTTRRASIEDLDSLVEFVLAEATEAEGATKVPTTVREGIRRGLEDPSIARYWVLVATQLAEESASCSKSVSNFHEESGGGATENDPQQGREQDKCIVVGSISIIREWSDWHATYYWWIQSMFLKLEFRGHGLMKYLVDVVKKAAQNEDAKELRLYVHRDNHRAIEAYQRDGFVASQYDIMSMKLL